MPEATVLHKTVQPDHTKKLSDGKYSFVISSETPDLAGDIVVQRGMKPISDRIPAQIDHSGRMRDVIGYWSDFKQVGRKTVAVLNLADKGISRTADLIRGLLDSGIRMASSIGFMSDDYEPISTGGKRFKTSKICEISVVCQPCQPDALSIAKSLGFEAVEAEQILADASPAQSQTPSVSADLTIDKSKAAILKANRLLRKLS